MEMIVTNDIWPNPATLFSNQTFWDESQAEYDAHKTGILHRRE
jgi:hypothetical protein